MHMPETQNQNVHTHVVATFATHEAADSALQYLNADAIPRDRITIRTAEVSQQPPQAPHETDGKLQEDEHRNLRTMGTGLAASGAGMAAAGAVIATGGAALPAIAAAALAGLGAGAASEGVAAAASPDVVPDEEKAVAVLVVAAANVDQAERAKGVLRNTSALRVWEE
jgi:mevalonate pyrophosphate decarboxylase